MTDTQLSRFTWIPRLLKDAFDDYYGPVPDDTVKKITGAADQPSQLLRRYKNEQLPKVAVTVDLLTTGIDVPEIVNLVFIRRVRSRILFEQTDDPIGEAQLVTLAAWALVEDGDGQTQLVGLVQKPERDDSPAGTFGFADETGGFVGYSNQGLKTKPAD